MTSRPRILGGWVPSPAPTVGYGIRVKSLGPLVTEWYPANLPAVTTVAGRAGDVLLSHTDITDWATSLAAYAPTNSPTFTGVPAAPTAAPGTTSTQLATTAFVASAISGSVAGVASFNTRTGAVTLSNADVTAVLAPASALPVMNGPAAIGTSGNWARADHVHPSDTNVIIDCGTF